MQKGVLKVKLLEINSEYFNGRHIIIGIRGNESSWQVGKIKCPSKFEDTETLFPFAQNIEISVFQNQETDTRFGYFKIPISKLFEYPNKNHFVITKCVWIQKNEGNKIEEGVAADVKISFVYLPNVSYSLTVKIESAELIRDVESVGKMDPYVECEVGDSSFKTEIQKEGGKNPTWNQELTFLLQTIPPQVIFTVKDKDMVDDNIIGKAKVNPHNCKWFREENVQREIEIQYQGKKSGTIKTSTLFVINQ